MVRAHQRESTMAERDPTFGGRLKELRQAAGWTQYELGVRSGVQPNTIARLEQGKAGPTWATVRALANALGISVAAFEEPPAKRRRRKGPGHPRKD
jgi:transcriptional regulator with XRE-family HTH domain